MGSPSGSLEPEPSKLTVSGTLPEVGVAVATAVGGLFVPVAPKVAYTDSRQLSGEEAPNGSDGPSAYASPFDCSAPTPAPPPTRPTRVPVAPGTPTKYPPAVKCTGAENVKSTQPAVAVPDTLTSTDTPFNAPGDPLASA